MKVYNYKNKIITQHKKNEFRAVMQIIRNYFKMFFEMTKRVKEAKKKIMSQIIISSLKNREKLIITAQNKIEVMFEIHFLFSSTMFIKNIKKFDYFFLIDDETLMTRRKIIKIIYNVNLNKTYKINKVINRMLQ